MFPTLAHTLLRLALSDPAFRSGMADGLQKRERAASRHVTFTESTRYLTEMIQDHDALEILNNLKAECLSNFGVSLTMNVSSNKREFSFQSSRALQQY
jgi:hypothetical protein